jgi:murein hydrolase activator
LEQTIASREQDLAGLSRDAQTLRLLVEHLRQRAQIQAELQVQRDPFAARRGHLSWPLLEARIRAGFGTSKPGSDQTWDGCLLAAREGEEVRAVYDGRVVFADWLLGFGLLLVIDHGDGFLSFYGHNQALLKEVGEWVTAAEVVGLGGNSGGRDEPVLYFAIRHHGEPIDPTQWCG